LADGDGQLRTALSEGQETVTQEVDNFDPTTAGSLEELVACLRRVHIHAGKPSYRSLEDKTKHVSGILPGTQLKQVPLTRAVLNDVLLGRKFPGKAFLLTFVSTCGPKTAVTEFCS